MRTLLPLVLFLVPSLALASTPATPVTSPPTVSLEEYTALRLEHDQRIFDTLTVEWRAGLAELEKDDRYVLMQKLAGVVLHHRDQARQTAAMKLVASIKASTVSTPPSPVATKTAPPAKQAKKGAQP